MQSDQGQDLWNDNEILEAFHSAIESHKCRGESFDEKRYRKSSQYRKRKAEEAWSDSNPGYENEHSAEATVEPQECSKGIFITTAGTERNHNSDKEEMPSARTYPPLSSGTCGPSQFAQNSFEYLHSRTASELRKENQTEEALSSMLMAWYQSGFATGRYYTLLEMQKQESTRGNVDEGQGGRCGRRQDCNDDPQMPSDAYTDVPSPDREKRPSGVRTVSRVVQSEDGEVSS